MNLAQIIWRWQNDIFHQVQNERITRSWNVQTSFETSIKTWIELINIEPSFNDNYDYYDTILILKSLHLLSVYMYVDLTYVTTLRFEKENFKQRRDNRGCGNLCIKISLRTDVVRVLKCHKYYLTRISYLWHINKWWWQ